MKDQWELVCVNLHVYPQSNESEEHALLGSTMDDVLEAVEDYMPGKYLHHMCTVAPNPVDMVCFNYSFTTFILQ